MIPIRLTLSNACQYDHFIYDYKAGITGITGRNGAGKTNLIYVLQQFAFTGKTKTNKTKDQLLKWGTYNGYTKLEFLHDNLEYTLKRSINTSKISLKQGNCEWKQTEANDVMQGILGMDSAVFFEVCFVPQGGLWNILEMTHSARMTYFQKLTDAWYAEQLRTMLDKAHKRIPTYPDKSDLLAQANSNVETYKEALKFIDIQLNEQTKLQTQFAAAVPEAQKILDMMRETDYLVAVDTMHNGVTNISLQIEAVAKPIEVPMIEYPKMLQTAKHIHEMYQTRLRNYERKVQLHTDANVELATLQANGMTEPDKTELENLEKQIVELENKLKGICPTCQQALPGAEEVDRLQVAADLQIIQATVGAVKKDLTECEDAYKIYTHDLAIVENKIASFDDAAEQKIVGEAVVFDPQELIDAEAAWTLYDQYQKDIAKYNESVKTLNDEHVRLTTLLQTAIAVPYVKDVSYTTAEELMGNSQRNDTMVTQLETKKQIEENNLLNAETQVKLFEDDKERGKDADNLRVKFDQCRDVLHRDKLPKIVMSNMLVGLNHHMNEMLSYFHMDFDALLDTDFNFRVACADNDSASSDDLSGGQKVILAIAFHIGLAKLLSGSIPFMVLDEPTNHIDEYNKPILRDALMRLRGAGSEGTEFIIVTHDDVLKPTFNREIKIIKE